MNERTDADGFNGPAVLRLGDARFDVRADLRGRFDPIDGRYHWYGRLARCDELDAAISAGYTEATLTTPAGTAPCRVSDPDLWHRYRVSGMSSPRQR